VWDIATREFPLSLSAGFLLLDLDLIVLAPLGMVAIIAQNGTVIFHRLPTLVGLVTLLHLQSTTLLFAIIRIGRIILALGSVFRR